MIWFTYTAIDRQGRTVSGTVSATNVTEAGSKVMALGLRPVRIYQGAGSANDQPTLKMPAQFPAAGQDESSDAAGQSGNLVPAGPQGYVSPDDWLLNHLVYPLWTGVGLRDQAMLYRQLGAMYDAGLPVHFGISTVLEQNKNGTLKRCLAGIKPQIIKGVPLSVAMARYPGFFPEFHRSVIAAGEATGALKPMLSRLADALEMDYNFRWELWKEVFTKGLFIFGNFIVWPMVMFYLSHNFLLMFLCLLPFVFAALFVGMIYIAVRLLKQVRFVYDALMARTWGIAAIAQGLSLARFCRVLASLYTAGVSLPTAVGYAADACGNYTLGEEYRKAVVPLQRGVSPVQAFEQTRAFPPLMMSMIGTAQETGTLSPLMDNIAHHYEQEAMIRLGRTSMTIGIVITVISGLFCLFLDLFVLGKEMSGSLNTGM